MRKSKALWLVLACLVLAAILGREFLSVEKNDNSLRVRSGSSGITQELQARKGHSPATTATREAEQLRDATRPQTDADAPAKSLCERLEAEIGAEFKIVYVNNDDEAIGPDGEEMHASFRTLDQLDHMVKVTFWWRYEYEDEWHESGSAYNERYENDPQLWIGSDFSLPTDEFGNCEIKVVYEAFDAANRLRFQTERFYRTTTSDSSAR